MAYYAEIENGTVKQVVVIDAVATEVEAQKFLETVSANQWVATCYGGSFRKKYAGIGDEYHADLDAFIHKPYKAWVLDAVAKEYVPPHLAPVADEGFEYVWSDQTDDWELGERRGV